MQIRLWLICLLALAAIGAASLGPASASLPMPKIYVGCVLDGAFRNADGYVIKIRTQSGKPINLVPLQNKKLRITGNLLPGDVFFLTAPPVIVGPC